MEKRKTNRKGFLALLLLLLVGVTSYYVSGTYAKYVGQVEGEGSATVAKWNFETDNADVDFTVDLAENYDASTLTDGKIAPGTEGSFKFNLKNTSEVGVDFTVTLGTVTDAPTNLKFYTDEAMTEELAQGGEITGQIAAEDATGLDITIYWAWAYEVDEAGNTADTADGEAAATLTIPVTVDGVQTTPSTTAITTHQD